MKSFLFLVLLVTTQALSANLRPCDEYDAVNAQDAAEELPNGKIAFLFGDFVNRSTQKKDIVGFIRYTVEYTADEKIKSVELVDLFTCGNSSPDYFYINDKATTPSNWLKNTTFKEEISADEGKMELTIKVGKEDVTGTDLVLNFTATSSEEDVVATKGTFYFKMPKSWYKK